MQKKFNFIDIIILSFYYFFICFLALGMFGWFERLAVIITLLFYLILLFFFRKKISICKKHLLFFLLVVLTGSGFALLRGFFTGDAYHVWLTAAKITVQSGSIPEFLTGWYYAGMPLLSLLFAATFSLFGQFNEFLCLWVPVFFTGATLILLWQWAKEKKIEKKFLIFVPILFLANSLVQFYGSWNLLQESLVLFFAAAFFYYYEKYLKNNQRKYLILFILSFVLACASKISGLFLGILLVFFFFKTKEKKTFLSYLCLFSVPMILWLARNYLIFENPFFPAFSGIFKGKYYHVVANYFAYTVFPDNLITLQGKIIFIFKLVLGIFPYIFLSLYGFLKKRRYDYLLLVVSFFLVKEIFLFTPTISAGRYYYLLIGLLIIYAVYGLQKIKSKIGLGLLFALAFGGLLMLPVTDSTSSFISSFENTFSLLGKICTYLQNYWYLALLGLMPFIWLALKKKQNKIFLLFLYSLYILHLSFIANKSWLNTWPFVLLAIILFIVFSFLKEFRYSRKIIIAIIVLAILANSWLMALVYHYKHGGIQFPVPFVWERNDWVRAVLNQQTSPEERNDFYILVAQQKGYYNWWTDYQAVAIFDYDFWTILSDFDRDLDASQLHQFLVDHKVKYIIKNDVTSGMPGKNDFEPFFEKVANADDLFILLARRKNTYFIWQVY